MRTLIICLRRFFLYLKKNGLCLLDLAGRLQYLKPSQKTRVITPILLQMEATECGAAALGIILAFYELYVPLEALRIACGVSRDGSKAVNMLKAARHYGLQAQGAKIEPDALNELTFPVIAFWEFNHFVVIEGFDDKKIYLNDPATGQRTITHEEFSRSFTGIILMFEPTSDFRQGGEKITLQKILIPRLKGLKKSLMFVTFASLALVIPGIIIPGFTKIFIDEVLINQLSGWITPLLWGIFLTALFRMALSWLQQYYLLRLEMKIAITSSARFLWHVLRLPLAFFSQRMIGDIESRVAANDRVAQLLSGDLSTSIVSLISMVFYAIILFLYDWPLASIAVIVTALNAAILYSVARGIEISSRRLQQESGKLSGVEMSGLQAIETIKATGAENDFFQRWAGYHANTLNSQQKINLYAITLSVLPQLLTNLLLLTVLSLGSWQIIQGSITIGTLVAFQSLILSFNEPLMTLLGLGSQLQVIRADLTRLADVQKHPEDPRFSITTPSRSEKMGDTSTPQKLQGKLTLSDVCFGHSPLEPPILNNINLTLNPGQRIAIVGNSGSGKSTLAKLICGLHIPWSGEIFWDQQPMSHISPETLSHSLAFVDQDIFLFEGSIQNNLTLWNHTVSPEIIAQAVEDTLLDQILAERPHGLHSQILPAGANFSGGQRQQLEIARALVQSPSILVLDEATAALDANTEQLLMDNLKKRGHSLLVVAHRLSTIRDSDEIIVLHKGRVAERGKHEELYQKKGLYYHLVQDAIGANHV
jgi:NHLM bacteriocin system ABC transporter peptidase/ATP-binding protein